MVFTKISGNYFTYDGIQSRQYGLRILHIDTNEETRVSGDIEYNTVFNRATKKTTIHSRNWDTSPLSFETEILSETPINSLDQDVIREWLFNRPNFARFYTESLKHNNVETVAGETRDVYIECVFYNPVAIIYAGSVYGWRCQCMTSSPMAIQEDIVKTFIAASASEVIVDVQTDLNDYVYPLMTITATTSGGIIEVQNTTDNRLFKVIDVPSSSVLYVDNAIGTITDDTGISLYPQLADRKFFRLLPGKNHLKFSGGIKKIELRWNNARWFR